MAKESSSQQTGTVGQAAAKNLHPTISASSTAQTVKFQAAKLPQTGELASGKQLSWIGLVLAAMGISGLWRKKRDDE